MTKCALTALTIVLTVAPCSHSEESALTSTTPLCGGGVLDIRLPELVKPADLRLSGSVPRSEAGLPIGNGRMGTLLWTTPAKLHMQINRVDVFANNKASNSFPERHTDYCNGCAFVDIDLGGEVFTDQLKQRLSMADGLATLQAEGVRIRAVASMNRDVIAIEVADERPQPEPINVQLRRLRPRQVKHLEHTALSRFSTLSSDRPSPSDRMALAQDFTEGAYYCGSAVGVAVTGRAARLEPQRREDEQVTLALPAARGKFTIYISSTASFQSTAPLVDEAEDLLAEAGKEKFSAHLAANAQWWSDFWNRGFVYLHSDDGAADMVQEHYYYYLYLMASTSRGKYPTKFNGML